MKICPGCGTSNKDENIFCIGCSKKIEGTVLFCIHCGNKIVSTNKFCKFCGNEIGISTAAISPGNTPQKDFYVKNQTPRVPQTYGNNQTYNRAQIPPKKKQPYKKLVIALSIILPVLFISLALAVVFAISGLPSDAETTTADSVKMLDLGVATVKDPDPEMMIESEVLGLVPANQVGIILAEGLNRTDAQNIADELSASIVGEIEFINFYQLETKDSTEGELIASLDKVSKLEGVDLAFPNGAVFLQATTEGSSCSPFNDPLYTEGSNSRPYEMIGVQNAWDIIKASGVKLNKVRTGIIDTAIYTKSDNGFSPELYFPDNKGKYPKGKVKIVPLDKDKDLTNDAKTDPKTGDLISGGLSHCTQMAHIIGADSEGGGPAGVSSILGEKQSIIVTNTGTIPATSAPTPALDIDATDITQYQGNTYSLLVDLKKQVENNVKVINLSLGSSRLTANNATTCQAYKLFFEKMNKEYPNVVFVATAGNEGGGVDGTNRGPGGISVPNLITVGALDQDGDRAKADDWGYDEKDLKKWYQEGLNDGSITKNTTYQGYVDSLAFGSNYATGNGEVTLSAVGTDVPVGLDPKGKAVTSNGTSVAAPQVTGAIALMQSINPKLSAEQIKKILNETKASEVERDGNKVTVPANVGGGILRVDDAVLKVINDMRKAKDKNAVELKKEDLLAMGSIKITASGGPEDYVITASVSAVGPGKTGIRIETSGNGVLEGSKTQNISAPGKVSWKLTKMSGGGTIKVFRSDTGGCAFLTIAKFEPDYLQDIPDIVPGTELPAELNLKGMINYVFLWPNYYSVPLNLNINFETQVFSGTYTYSGPGPSGESFSSSKVTINGTVSGKVSVGGNDGSFFLYGDYSEKVTWDQNLNGGGIYTYTFTDDKVFQGHLKKDGSASGEFTDVLYDYSDDEVIYHTWSASPE
jgi:hypothetical protein